MPKISIITVNKDNAVGLKRTINSVVNQTYTDYEWIIIDAASKDESVDLIQQHKHHLSYWVSELDNGIYAGMNKGLMRATGEYLLFLNSGDSFVDNKVLQKIGETSLVADIVLGKVNICSDEQGVIQKDYTIPYLDLTLFSLYLYSMPHQASLIKRKLFEECGLYDENCKVYADWKFFVDVLILKNKTLQHIPITIANYDATGISSANTNINKQCLQREHQEIFKDLIPERIRKDYEKALQLYNDIYRIKWLLKRPLLYKLFRITTALEMKIFK
jgi:glycosyltransferase involved in cell wall biosynthesis